jgi:SWI/SNF-related matrix-associated actin-dependent regulator of chromatin subfamily A member 5
MFFTNLIRNALHLLVSKFQDYFIRKELEESNRKAEKKAAKQSQDVATALQAVYLQDPTTSSSSAAATMHMDMEQGFGTDDKDIMNTYAEEQEINDAMDTEENLDTSGHLLNESFTGTEVDAHVSPDQNATAHVFDETSINNIADSLNVEASSSTKICPQEVADDNEEIDEVKLFYSTLEGVVNVDKPSILQADLHDHQVTGISWMVHMFKNGMPMILGDQMGLGKTLQTIGFLSYLFEKLNKKGPHLVVVPLSVLSNWMSEIERFCPSFRAVRFHGPKSERDRIKEEELSDLKEFDIVVTTFEILVSEVNFFRRKYVWTTVIVDEGHRLKNDKSQLSEKLRCVPCISKILLTGTPLQNNLHELWALLYYLVPDIFTSSEPFDEGFDLLRGVIDNVILRKARKMLSVFMLRRVKEQVDIKLPSRKEVTLLVNLTTQQIDLYKQILCGLDASMIEVVMREGAKDVTKTAIDVSGGVSSSSNGNVADMEGQSGNDTNTALVPTTSVRSTKSSREEVGGGNDSDWRKLMNILLQLRKICNHTYLLPHVAPEPYEATEDIVTGSGKLLMLDRMLPPLRADGHRVLIFSQFTSMLDILEDYCELRDYPFVRLDGETNRVKRRLDVRRFNAPNSPLFIFLISTRAGGLGLNLASADTVILYDSDW